MLKKDRELLWIPVLSFLASAAVIVVVLALTFLTLSTTSSGGETTAEFNPAMIVLFVVAAMALGVIGVFFNGALVAGAHERLTGGDPTVRSAVARAFARIGGLVPWAIITTTVGLILQALRDRAGWLGRIVTHMLDMAWQVVTFLTVPAIVIDNLGAIEALKRSASLLRQTWGENLAAPGRVRHPGLRSHYSRRGPGRAVHRIRLGCSGRGGHHCGGHMAGGGDGGAHRPQRDLPDCAVPLRHHRGPSLGLRTGPPGPDLRPQVAEPHPGRNWGFRGPYTAALAQTAARNL